MTINGKQKLMTNPSNEPKGLRVSVSELLKVRCHQPPEYPRGETAGRWPLVKLTGFLVAISVLFVAQAKEQHYAEGLRGSMSHFDTQPEKVKNNHQQLTSDDAGIIEEPPFAGLPAPQSLSQIDEANVNVVSNLPQFQLPTLSIGNGVSQLSHAIATYEAGYFWNFNDDFTVSNFPIPGPSYRTVTIGHRSQVFQLSNNVWVPLDKDGATLVYEGSNWVYTANDGLEYHTQGAKIIYPNGLTVTRHWSEQIALPPSGNPNSPGYWIRQQAVRTNTGLQIKYDYASDEYPNYPCPGVEDSDGSSNCGNNQRDVLFPNQVTAINNAIDYCDPVANNCTYSKVWPIARFSWPSADSMWGQPEVVENNIAKFSVTDAMGLMTTYTHEKFLMMYGKDLDLTLPGLFGPRYATRITRVESPTVNATYKYIDHVQARPTGSPTAVQYVTRSQITEKATINGAQWTYDLDTADTIYVTAGGSTGPKGRTYVVMHNTGGNSPGFKVQAGVPGIRQAYRETQHGNYVETSAKHGKVSSYEYDSRGNITKVTMKSTDGVAGNDIVLEANYPVDCVSLKYCNKPLWTKDGEGNQTDYTYHEPSGQLATVTLPAPGGTNTVRPQIRYHYQQLFARFKASSDAITTATTGVWMLTKMSRCISSDYDADTETCQAENDEEVTTYLYDGFVSGANNLWVTGKKVEAKGQTLLFCYEYDYLGNRIGEISPNAGLTECPKINP